MGLYEQNHNKSKAHDKKGEYDFSADFVLAGELHAPVVLKNASFWRMEVNAASQTAKIHLSLRKVCSWIFSASLK